ncbi:MAG: InlB B-repeat-containing protein [Christensenellales bacterium]
MKRKLIALTLMLVTSLILLNGCSVYETQTGSNDNKKDEQISTKTVTINLNVNGGEQLERSIFIGNAGEPMSLPTPKRDGYTFDKWYNGYDLIDQNVYPDTDMHLTARWFALNDTEKSFSYSTPLNQQYEGSIYSKGKLLKIDFTEDETEQIIYLKKNYDIECTFTLKFEATCVGTSGIFSTVQLTGANELDVLLTAKIPTSTPEYVTYTIDSTALSRVFVGNDDDPVLRLYLFEDAFGISYPELYVRNIVIEVNYIERKGSWV